jgi:hypothetical protein
LVTSNQPFSEWKNVFSTSAMTVAAVDRLVEHSTIVQISGESYRPKRARRSVLTWRQLPANVSQPLAPLGVCYGSVFAVVSPCDGR